MELNKQILSLDNNCPDSLCKKYEGIDYPKAEHLKYYSKTCGMERNYNIILPPSYDKNKKYPVCYLLHGIMCDEFMFTGDEKNCVSEIFSNLISQKKAKEMILVFPDIFAKNDPDLKQAFELPVFDAYDNFINELINDLMPFIESNYSVLKGKENTAVCGFSMGGREAINIGLNRPDLFDYIGAISPAPGVLYSKDLHGEHQGLFTNDNFKYQIKGKESKFFMICCGDDDKVVVHFPSYYHKVLEENNVNHIWFEVPNADHNHVAIKSGLYHFLSAAFN